MREATGTHVGEAYQLLWHPAQTPQTASLPQSLEHMLNCPQPNHNLRQELGPIHASPETGKYLAQSPLLLLHECLRLPKDQQGGHFCGQEMSVVVVDASSPTPGPSEVEVTFLKLLNHQLQSLAAFWEV